VERFCPAGDELASPSHCRLIIGSDLACGAPDATSLAAMVSACGVLVAHSSRENLCGAPPPRLAKMPAAHLQPRSHGLFSLQSFHWCYATALKCACMDGPISTCYRGLLTATGDSNQTLISLLEFMSTTSFGSPGSLYSAVAFASRLFFGCLWFVTCVVGMLLLGRGFIYTSSVLK
jgi:hypothetical protein